MAPDESVRSAANRLGAISWERHGHRAWSKAALLKEYLRRAARWATALNCDPPTPFYDIAACVDPAVRADPATVERVVQIAKDGKARSDVCRTLPLILHWAAVRTTPGRARFDLEDPFEPLILMFERDGGFHMDKGLVNIEYKSMRLSDWRDREEAQPMPSFDAHSLDEIDRAGSIDQFGYIIEPM